MYLLAFFSLVPTGSLATPPSGVLLFNDTSNDEIHAFWKVGLRWLQELY